MDWNKISADLSAPLDPKHVKGRSQGGGQVQYIEGWHAIAEMNRIFGFGEWSRETIELRQLGEPREVNGKVRVDYMARVRVTVQGIVRDGCGFGQGIDKDIGQAHESGLKEAETDAMKRAMMTFGNPFGLALYDKTRANVRTPEVSDSKAALAKIKESLAKTPANITEDVIRKDDTFNRLYDQMEPQDKSEIDNLLATRKEAA